MTGASCPENQTDPTSGICYWLGADAATGPWDGSSTVCGGGNDLVLMKSENIYQFITANVPSST